jgi:hypothetical protein
VLDSTEVFGQAWLPDLELNIVAPASTRISSEDEHPYEALQPINQFNIRFMHLNAPISDRPRSTGW